MEKLSEREIIFKIKNGEINYFEYFVKKYSPVVFSYVVKKIGNTEDAKDIVQNAFIKVYKAMDRLDPDRSFYAFLFAIIKNELVNFLRSKPVHVPLDEKIANYLYTNPDEKFHIFDTLQKLKKDYRKVIQLVMEGYSYKEISKILRKPINTVKTHIRRAKKELKYYDKE